MSVHSGVGAPGGLASALSERLDALVGQRQVDWRAPGVLAALARAGQPAFTAAVGLADTAAETPVDPGMQLRIGSITKTFTAVLVMQCRDEGLLDLDDRLEQHLPGTAHGGLSIRRMLAHVSGLQREPVGEVWERPAGPGREELLAGLEQAEAVLPPGRRWHYSNLAYALLGELVARKRGQPWEVVLAERVLEPLGLSRTTTRRQAPYATGYLTDPFADRVHPEPEFPGNAFAPAAELWSTVADLTRWGAFLADPARFGPGVLSAGTVEEMCHPQVIADLDGWTLGWGLGLQLHRRGERVLVGHGGAMPGFLASLVVRRPERLSAAVLVNTTAGADPGGLAIELLLRVLEDAPATRGPWRPGPPVPAEVEPLLGVWFSEGSQLVFSYQDGALRARPAEATAERLTSVFAPEGQDRYRVVSGREHGELLRIVREADGSVARMYLATYPVTRQARPFGP